MIIGMFKGRGASAARLALGIGGVLLVGLLLGGILFSGDVPVASARDAGAVSDSGELYYDVPPGPSAVSNYVLMGVKWEKNPVTYSITNCPKSLDCGLAHQAVREAIETWDAVCGLQLDEVAPVGDIELWWASGSHGDGMPFDGPGNQLAHAIAPIPWLGDLAGDVHFDDDETWVVDTPTNSYQIHLKTVAMHEVGHALGLDHSHDPAALMWPEYEGVRGLAPDDIAGIQALYGPPGPNEGAGAPVVEPASSGVTATSTATVRMRSGPGTDFPTAGRIPYDATVPVLGRNADSSWLYIEYYGQRGWSAAFLFTVAGDLSALPVVGEEGGGIPPAASTGVTATAKITTRVRSGPGTGYPQVSRVVTGSTVPVLGRNASNSWLYVEVNGIQGWSSAQLYTINGDLNAVPTMAN
ncbi:MAG: matrixin family metalloprotease [Anaerolineae bacterium]|nr:matrixin family metalloprotease [Anaerolineae bacterium]